MKKIVALVLVLVLILAGCGKEAALRETEPTWELPEAEQTTQTPEPTEESLNLPPALDQAFPYLTLDRVDASLKGGTFLMYLGCADGGQALSTIEEYIAMLNDYGYTLFRSEVFAGCYYVYWLESSEPDLEAFTYRDQSCHLALEAAIDPEFGWKDVYAFYSPTILGYYTGDATYEPSGGSGSGDWDTEPSGSSVTKIRCSKCGGDGEMTCTNCDGWGYKESRVSAPNYSGKGTKYETVRERCFKCRGTGDITCTRCDGEGKH